MQGVLLPCQELMAHRQTLLVNNCLTLIVKLRFTLTRVSYNVVAKMLNKTVYHESIFNPEWPLVTELLSSFQLHKFALSTLFLWLSLIFYCCSATSELNCFWFIILDNKLLNFRVPWMDPRMIFLIPRPPWVMTWARHWKFQILQTWQLCVIRRSFTATSSFWPPGMPPRREGGDIGFIKFYYLY